MPGFLLPTTWPLTAAPHTKTGSVSSGALEAGFRRPKNLSPDPGVLDNHQWGPMQTCLILETC